MKLPEIPGKIIAQIAIIPQMKTNKFVVSFAMGGSEVTVHAMAAPTMNEMMVPIPHLVTCFPTKKTEASSWRHVWKRRKAEVDYYS